MERCITGRYVPSAAGGISCQASIPAPLPPVPALLLGRKLQQRTGQAMATALRNQHKALLPQLGDMAGSARQLLDALAPLPASARL